MDQANFNSVAASTAAPPLWRRCVEIALVFAVFYLHGAWPTPDVNETGYLTKAEHFWNPNAFAHDFFCNTGDAHVVFYWTFGWLTTLGLSLDTVAWIGRIVTWLLLAIAWRGLSYSVVPKAWLAVLTAELFVLLTEQTHMAGEWIIGGAEAKGFAWAFVLWSLHALICGRWNLAWILAGVATSLHVVVGGWAAVCLGLVWIASRKETKLPSMLPGIIGWLIFALPGLIYVGKINQGTSFDTVLAASKIQVYERLPHHLFPLEFTGGYVGRHLMLWAFFFLLCAVVTPTLRDRLLRRFVFSTIGLAVAGFVLAWIASIGETTADSNSPPAIFAASLLRFYWSRMSDIIVPLGVSLVGMQYLSGIFATRHSMLRWICAVMVALIVYDAYSQLRHFSTPFYTVLAVTRADRDDALTDLRDVYHWRQVCEWAADNTQPGTVFLTPMNSSTFKWYSGRDEVATWKDMPQDAKSIVKWWNHLRGIFGAGLLNGQQQWKSLAETGNQNLRSLGAQYGADYVIVQKSPEELRAFRRSGKDPNGIYENSSFTVYQANPQAIKTDLPPDTSK
jgi:hypothetical protein